MEKFQESIFSSALRGFCKTFCVVSGIFVSIFLFCLLYPILFSSPLVEPATTTKILADASEKREALPLSSPAILQLNIHGIIGEPNGLDSDVVHNILIESRTGLFANDRIKGVLIHFNTPGGTVTDSDNIYRMLQEYKNKYKVPIFGYIDGTCASGGMYIAAAADQVYASPASVIGSIGVRFGPFFNISSSLDKIGVEARTLTEGSDKDAMTPFRPWKEGEDESYKVIMKYFYERFVNIVTKGRPEIDKTKLMNEYGARVFDPFQAKKIGYIDRAESSRNEALLALLEVAQIDPETPYQVVELAPRREWLANIMDNKNGLLNGKVEHRLEFSRNKIRDQFAYLYQPE